jgi:hypothetical protein
VKKKRFLKGQLVKIRIEGLTYTRDGFATVTHLGGSFKIFEKINLEDDLAVIVGFVGRPENIAVDPQWFEYDVYEILIGGAIRQIFRQNISLVSS